MNSYRYILYARKSSEDKSRQVTSIEDQIKELNRLANDRGLLIVDTIFESKSAKKPGREGFNKMLEKIHQGEADAILCWKLDRLARNPIDHGNIAWMLQQGLIQRIQTFSSEYKPSDNVLMMQVEFGMATQYIKDLNVNVSRGTRLKAERGWYPSSVLPVGYKHNPLYLANESTTEIILDKKSFEKVKQLWDLILTGTYGIAEIKRHGDAIGLRSKKGNKLSHSTYEAIFKNKFYAGYFYWKNAEGVRTLHKGKHKPIVSMVQFEKVQEILFGKSRPTRTRERTHLFPFRGIVSCGECSGYVTAEFIHQVICTNCKLKYSVKTNTICRKCNMDYLDMINPIEIKKKYYRCSKKKHPNCTQKSIEESQLMELTEQFTKDLQIDENFYQWAKQEVEYLIQNIETTSISKELTEREKNIEKRITGLVEMKADGLINSERFKSMNEDLQKELSLINIEKNKDIDNKEETLRLALHHLSIARNAENSFVSASLKDKKHIVREFGYNLILKDKSLSIIRPKWISYLQDYIAKERDKKPWVQPKKVVEKYRELGCFTPLIPNRLAETEPKRTD